MTKDKLEFLEEYGGTIHEQSYSISMDTEDAKAALTDYGKQEAIAFANWIDGQQLECDLMTDDGEKHWVYMFPERHGKKRFTSEELYALYINQSL